MEQNWYAIKVFFNKVFEMEVLLDNMDLETYIPTEKVLLKGPAHIAARKKLADISAPRDSRFIEEGPKIFQRKPLVTSLIFVKADDKTIKSLSDDLHWHRLQYQGFVYNKADTKEPSAIPASQMEAFRLVADSGASGLEFFADDDITRFKQGSKVRVKEGPLKGAEGYIKRIKKDRRLLVSIEGVIAVATSFIPPENLEIVS
ncbi:MAG: transcriptional regulator [Bacteroidales bacterium]|nr:transcriptional regulator [Bacteroidales bacterium]